MCYIEEFNPNEASSTVWDAYHELRELYYKELFPTDLLPPREYVEQEMCTSSQEKTFQRLLLFADEDRTKLVGSTELKYSTDDDPAFNQNKHKAEALIVVHKEYRNQGKGKLLLDQVLEEVRKIGRTVLEVWSSHPAGIAVCEHYGGQVVIHASQNRLQLNEINGELVNHWVTEGQQKNVSTSLVVCDEVPEDDLGSFCDAMNAAAQTAPTGGLGSVRLVTPERRRKRERQDRKEGKERITLFAQEPDGRVSGITEMIFIPQLSDRINQGWTGVRAEDRGRGLGKWLKAQMLVLVQERYPSVSFVITGNADSNDSMLSINRRLGFKTYSSGIGFMFNVNELANQLGKPQSGQNTR